MTETSATNPLFRQRAANPDSDVPANDALVAGAREREAVRDDSALAVSLVSHPELVCAGRAGISPIGNVNLSQNL
jgi:hypothetical protein